MPRQECEIGGGKEHTETLLDWVKICFRVAWRVDAITKTSYELLMNFRTGMRDACKHFNIVMLCETTTQLAARSRQSVSWLSP